MIPPADLPVADQKARYRSLLRQRLRELPSPERLTLSQQICHHLRVSAPYARARAVALYLPLPTEVDLRPLLEEGPRRRFYLPRMGEGGQLDFCLYRPGEELVRASLGVVQPRPERPAAPPGEVDLFLVPGLGFDGRGFRLGRGAGWYDRGLRVHLDHAYLVGVAFEIQVVERLPHEPWDIPMHSLCTERGIRAQSSAAAPSPNL